MRLTYCAALVAFAAAQQPFVPPNSPVIPSEIWPLPASMTTGTQAALIPSSLTFTCGASDCPDPLPAAFQRYRDLIFFAGAPDGIATQDVGGLNVIYQVSFIIANVTPLVYGVSEAYNISVPTTGAATITATTQWGALRALESFSQLIVWQGSDAPGNQYMITNTPIAVQDSPRFQWRGFLIDTSFNYMTVPGIKLIIDAMSYAKFNILHWHATDDPSWPIVSQQYPNFTTYGPYSKQAIYSIQDQLEIRQYAHDRGILILMELDMPGHAEIWKAGNPDYVISCDGNQTLLNPIDGSGIYDVIRNLIVEFNGRFPGMPFIHLGGDEVSSLDCWARSPAVVKFMNESNIPTVEALREYFQIRVQKISNDLGLRVLMWEEVFNNGFTYLNTSVVTPWITPTVTQGATAINLSVVNYFSYYLDQQVPPGAVDPPYTGATYYFWVDTWQTFFNYDPVLTAGVAPENAHLVLGGTASLWGEQVDGTLGGLQATARAWPRAAATAERLWSPAIGANATDAQIADATGRLAHFRCHIAQRGIPAGPLSVGSDYGFCWNPTWATASAPVAPSDSTSTGVSTGGAVAIGLSCAAVGAALALWLPSQLKKSRKSGVYAPIGQRGQGVSFQSDDPLLARTA